MNERVKVAAEKEKEKKLRMEQDELERQAELERMGQQDLIYSSIIEIIFDNEKVFGDTRQFLLANTVVHEVGRRDVYFFII